MIHGTYGILFLCVYDLQIRKLGRWETVEVVRTLSTEQAKQDQDNSGDLHFCIFTVEESNYYHKSCYHKTDGKDGCLENYLSEDYDGNIAAMLLLH